LSAAGTQILTAVNAAEAAVVYGFFTCPFPSISTDELKHQTDMGLAGQGVATLITVSVSARAVSSRFCKVMHFIRWPRRTLGLQVASLGADGCVLFVRRRMRPTRRIDP
jgi:hypothetical protein